jgi:hypothetical protein
MEWLAVAKQYQGLWNFPHSVGASVKETRCTRWSNKKVQWILYSIVLFALVGTNSNFIIDAGCQEIIYDGIVFMNTGLYIKLQITKRLPQPVPSNGREKKFHTFLLEMKLLLQGTIFWKFIRDNVQRAQKNEFSITESAEPAELWKIYLASCHQFPECFLNLCFWNWKKINS